MQRRTVRLKALISILIFLLVLTGWTCYNLQRKVEAFTGTAPPAGYHSYVRLSSISLPMQDATIAMEDGHFYSHHGFDWAAMRHAFWVDVHARRIKEGGSTITQQLAKNLFLTPDRTIWRKIQEAAYTVEMERRLSKGRILELYLNTIDYGMGQHGIKNAAAYYVHTTPDKLTLAESAVLVGLVPSPPHRALDADRLDRGRQTALGRIAFFFPNAFTEAQIQAAGQVPVQRLVWPLREAGQEHATIKPAITDAGRLKKEPLSSSILRIGAGQ